MSARRITCCEFAILLAVLLATPVSSAPTPGHEDDLARCIRRSSHGRKWLEVTLWGLRDQEGGWAGAAVRNADGSSDLGPLQINSWWVPRLAAQTGASEADVRRWLTHDICFNVDAGRWIFLTGLAATGDYWAAIGAYHSPDPERATRYARTVARRIQLRFGPGIFAVRGDPDKASVHEVME